MDTYDDPALAADFVDKGGDAMRNNTLSIGTPTSSDFTTSIEVAGLDAGDMVPVEVWVVLKSSIGSGFGGNVPTRFESAETSGTCEAGQKINSGAQNIPLLQVQDFFSSNVDVSITKTDSPDPVDRCGTIHYSVVVSNAGPSVANNVTIIDALDPNTSLVSGTFSGPAGWAMNPTTGGLTIGPSFLGNAETATFTFDVLVGENAPVAGTINSGGIGACPASGADVCNYVSVTTISNDNVQNNNTYHQSTDVLCPAIVITMPPPPVVLEGCSTGAIGSAIGSVYPVYSETKTNGIFPGTTSPSCGPLTVTYQDSQSGTCPIVVTRTWTLTNTCGNSTTSVQTFTIDDTKAPIITVPSAELNLDCFNQTDVDNWIATATALDECDGTVEVTASYNAAGTCSEGVEVTFTATDACGNVATATKKFYVNDNIPPSASNLAPLTVECKDDIPAPDITLITNETDNCTAVPIVTWLSDVSDGNTCPEVVTRTYKVADDCGNFIVVTQVITVVDTKAPVISTEATSHDLGCNPTVTDPVFTGLDNCVGVFTPIVNTAGPTHNGCAYTQTWTATYTDACTNVAVPVSITYTWTEDLELPVISTEATSHDLGCNPTVTDPVFTGLDNCEGVFTPDC